MKIVLDYLCPVCFDKAHVEFATQGAADEFRKIWDRAHPDSPHPSIAKTQEKIEKKRKEKL